MPEAWKIGNVNELTSLAYNDPITGFVTMKSVPCRVCIHIPHGGGSEYMPEAWKIGNVNELTSLAYNDPITGFVTMKSVPCRVEKE